MKTIFVIEIDGVAQTERNYPSLRQAQQAIEYEDFPDYLRGKAKVVKYVPE